MDRKGNIDEWSAIVKQQIENQKIADEMLQKEKKAQFVEYGQELKMEHELKEKMKEVEKYERMNELELANKKKLEYDTLLNKWKEREQIMKGDLAQDYLR